MYKPNWFRDGEVVVSAAPTCGINKDGSEQFSVDPITGERSADIDDKLYADAERITKGNFSSGYVFTRRLEDVKRSGIYVPKYHDRATIAQVAGVATTLPGFSVASLGELVSTGHLVLRKGHGSPSSDQRLGEVPYIKVSDLRAGHININPTNLVPIELAKKRFWRGAESGLKAYDLISPERASKNIGEFCVLMPGQEQIVLTKEVMVLRATEAAQYDQFYLMWALSLQSVRAQWDRVILMQTNREDVGDRAFEIVIPIPPNRGSADALARPFREYYGALEIARRNLTAELARSPHRHHIFLG